MKRKSLWRISITTTIEAEEAVTELLGAILNQTASSHFNVETQVSVVSVFGLQKIILARGVREEISTGDERRSGMEHKRQPRLIRCGHRPKYCAGKFRKLGERRSQARRDFGGG